MGYIDREHHRKIFEENGLGSRLKAVEGGCFPLQSFEVFPEKRKRAEATQSGYLATERNRPEVLFDIR